MNVCIKVDTNEIPNGNYTTSNLNGNMIQPYAKSTITSSNEANNLTLVGDTELSASERTRRLIPYMAFYVPVSELPINKQYVSKHNVHATKQLVRPTATGDGGTGPNGGHIPIPPQYVHNTVQFLPSAPSAASSLTGEHHQHYHSTAGLNNYHTHDYGEGQQKQQQNFNLVPTITVASQHLQAPGPPGPSAAAAAAAAAALQPFVGHGKGNGNNAFVSYKEHNPIRQKTVQYFPPLSSTASSASSSSSASAFETSSFAKQQPKLYHPPHHQHHLHHHQPAIAGSNSGNIKNNAPTAGAVGYRPRTKQSKINLTPFTTSNKVPGNFVPIVYTPLSSNNNDNYKNNILNGNNAAGEAIDGATFQQEAVNKQYPQQPQQIPLEYSSGALPPSVAVTSIPSLAVHPHYHHNQQQEQHHQEQQYNSKQQSATVLNNFEASGAAIASDEDAINSAHHQHHHSTEAIGPPNIYHQNQYHHRQQEQHLQPEDVIIDASLPTTQKQQPQTVTVIGSQLQQQLLHGGKSALNFQPPKPESFFESEMPLQQQHQYNVNQVLKDVNSYSIKNSQMLTPQEKYVMYLQQRINYNKHQQRHHHAAPRYTNRENIGNNNIDKEQEQHQYVKQQGNPNSAQFFVLSSTTSPSSHGAVTAFKTPIQPPQASAIPFDSNYPQHSAIHHELYPRPDLKPLGGGSGPPSNGADEEEQILTIPVHTLFSELETLSHQQQHTRNHYTPTHSVSPSPRHKSQYSKNRPSKPQYVDYIIDEPKQSLEDEQHQQHQLEVLKPTLGPPSHAFILVTSEPAAQENYASSTRPSHKSKPKLRLQPVLLQKNVNYPTIREQNPTESITLAPPKFAVHHHEAGEIPKYVYIKEEFGQKLSTIAEGGGVKSKTMNNYGSADSRIPQQHNDDVHLQPLEPTKLPIGPQNNHHHHNEVQVNTPAVTPPKTILADPNELPDIRTSSLAEILHKLQESNHLPHTLTPDNIDNSIKTLIRILNNLKQTQTIVANPPQHHDTPAHSHSSSPDYDYATGSEEEQQHQPQQESHDLSLLTPTGPNKHPGPSTGRPGIDYPNYADIPQTSFDCSQQRYKGFFGDPETNCQVWHYCDLNGGKASFLCPNGTIFSQIALTCDWWFNVKCATTAQLYVLNERLYKYILPFTPKFPEDYSGPIVDKYLAMKFQEMEEKMRLEKEKALQEAAEASTETIQPEPPISEDSKEDNHLEETTVAESDAARHVKSDTLGKAAKHESVNSQVSEQSSERNLLIDDEVNDISQRGAVNNFETTTIPTISATRSPDPHISFSLNPIIVSSTLGPDYDDDLSESHENDKRSDKNPIDGKETNKTKTKAKSITDNDKSTENETGKSMPSEANTASLNTMQVTVEKVEVIEIKADQATGPLIRDMLLDTKQTNQ